MSALDNNGANSPLLELDDLPKDEAGAVFVEPWHAEVFSMVHLLVDRGQFTVGEWAEMLGGVIKERPDDESYYQCWLAALERMTLQKGLVEEGPLNERKDAWDRAARATPHGEPIVLERDKP